MTCDVEIEFLRVPKTVVIFFNHRTLMELPDEMELPSCKDTYRLTSYTRQYQDSLITYVKFENGWWYMFSDDFNGYIGQKAKHFDGVVCAYYSKQ